MKHPDDQLPALLNLLDDPDELTFRLVREKICAFGSRAEASLQEIRETTLDPVLRERTEELLQEVHRKGFEQEFTDWMMFGSSDLLQGFLLISAYLHPGIDREQVITEVEKIRMDIWLELNDNLTALENVKVMNHILFDLLRFDGDRVNMFAESNQFIDTLLHTRRGSPLTLGMLYLILAQKLKLPIRGVNLPQHFILAYMSTAPLPGSGRQEVLFYINPFNRGAVFTREQIDLFLNQLQVTPGPAHFLPCSPLVIMERLTGNLILTYTQLNRHDVVDEVKRIQDRIRET